MTFPSADLAFFGLSSLPSAIVEVVGKSFHLISSVFASTTQVTTTETLEDRLASVSTIRITPSKFVGYEGQKVTFTALAKNLSDQIVQGVKFSWVSSDTQKVQINDAGEAVFLGPGLYTITCRAGSALATAPVLVRPGRRPFQSDAEWKADQVSLSATGPTGTAGDLRADSDPVTMGQNSTFEAQIGGSDLAYDELWSEPRNLVGTPRTRRQR